MQEKNTDRNSGVSNPLKRAGVSPKLGNGVVRIINKDGSISYEIAPGYKVVEDWEPTLVDITNSHRLSSAVIAFVNRFEATSGQKVHSLYFGEKKDDNNKRAVKIKFTDFVSDYYS